MVPDVSVSDVFASRYEVEVVDTVSHTEPWAAYVFLVSKTTRRLLRAFSGDSAADVRALAYEYLRDRPR